MLTVDKEKSLVDYEFLLKEGFSNIKEFEFGELFFNKEKNIFVFIFALDIVLNKNILEQKYNLCNEFSKEYYLINVMQKVKATSEAYAFYNNPERANYIKKEAFILNSTSLILAANFYFKIKKNNIPSKIYKNLNDALEFEF